MDRQKTQESISKIQDKYEAQDFKKCHELIKHFLKHSTYTLDLLLQKMKCEEQLKKLEDSLKTANMILFLQPNNFEAHQTKLRLSQNLQKFNQLTEQILQAKVLFPNKQFV